MVINTIAMITIMIFVRRPYYPVLPGARTHPAHRVVSFVASGKVVVAHGNDNIVDALTEAPEGREKIQET